MPDPDAALRALLPFFDCEKQILSLQELEERIKALVDRARALPKEAEVTGTDYFFPHRMDSEVGCPPPLIRTLRFHDAPSMSYTPGCV